MSFPLFKGRLRYEEASAIKMLHCGVENILAPKDASAVIDAVERETDRGLLMDEIIHAVSNHEMFISKVTTGPDPMDIKDAFDMVRSSFRK